MSKIVGLATLHPGGLTGMGVPNSRNGFEYQILHQAWYQCYTRAKCLSAACQSATSMVPQELLELLLLPQLAIIFCPVISHSYSPFP